MLEELQGETGCAVIFITHDMAVVRRIADRVLVMRGGKTVETGACTDILTHPREDYTRTLITATLPAAPRQALPDAGRTGSPATLVVEDLIVSFPRSQSLASLRTPDRIYAVDGVSLTVGEGETVALVGESGSGKTTIARAILGLVEPDDGRMLLNGKDLSTSRNQPRGKVQFVFQDPQSSLDPRFRAWRSVTEPLRIAGESEQGETAQPRPRSSGESGTGRRLSRPFHA